MNLLSASADALMNVAMTALPGMRTDDGYVAYSPEADEQGYAVSVLICSGSPGSAAISADIDREGAADTDRLVGSLHCSIEVASGTEDSKPLRDRALEILEAIRRELRTRQPLVPGVLRAHVSGLDLAYLDVDNGRIAVLDFTVQVDAFDYAV